MSINQVSSPFLRRRADAFTIVDEAGILLLTTTSQPMPTIITRPPS